MREAYSGLNEGDKVTIEFSRAGKSLTTTTGANVGKRRAIVAERPKRVQPSAEPALDAEGAPEAEAEGKGKKGGKKPKK